MGGDLKVDGDDNDDGDIDDDGVDDDDFVCDIYIYVYMNLTEFIFGCN